MFVVERPVALLSLFWVVTLAPAAGLLWLGAQLIDQDRALERQRKREAEERASDLAVALLQQKLAAMERRLNDPAPSPPDDGVILAEFGPHGVEVAVRLPFYPETTPLLEAPAALFSRGEAAEFRQVDLTQAIRVYRGLAESRDPAIRAGALVRLARCLRKSGDAVAALRAYNELAATSGVGVGGVPVDLAARRARCALLADLRRRDELRTEAAALDRDLHAGRWRLTRAVYQIHAGDSLAWLPARTVAEPETLAAAAVVEWLWGRWKSQDLDDHGRAAVGPATVFWRQGSGRLTALIAGPEYVKREWLAAVPGARIEIADSGGRTAAETGLPWSLLVSRSGSDAESARMAARRRLLLSAFALIVVVLFAGSYFISRAISREVAVARLQSDFVAAVSHEFRTPLAALHQVTELLRDGRVAEESKRQSYYDALARSTERLRRLVEGLLDFGRMEAGARLYCFERLDAEPLIRSVVEEFGRDAAGRGHRIELDMDAALPAISADREALERAVWNLLDNAAKYSPDSSTVWVRVAAEGAGIAIRVRDQGLGISPAERREIFRKFVRGSGSSARGIKGTGIGLAMVRQIVEAHRGEVRVESRLGEGSTFTLLLPAVG